MGVIFALFLSLLYSIIIVYVLYLIKKYTDKKYFNKYLHNIPGPKPHVFFGNAMEFVPGHKGVVLGLYKLVKMLLTPLSTRSTKAGQSQKVQKTVRTADFNTKLAVTPRDHNGTL
ncbi:unnamed protein product [Acanthoscelides obtectus]|uniref:Uncharacterized protein n=1 Tax=Acanthoscelides obtectus TaxID=200917 RepID=A0A9P0K3K4_ACAOB|nr:unnamed protein product [Acanthoscelides obtectus]CAK1622655.1 hypothetical protein AOBTE_LOCUS1612 [Acanthoscelides obtectus]